MTSEEKWERRTESFFTLLSLASLGLAYLMVGICLFHAMRDGRLADLWAPPTGGNHGPWRRYWPARAFLEPSILFVLAAGLLAAISLRATGRRLPILVLLGCANYFLVYIAFFAAALD